ncbi:MAG TPA: adenylate/guanylate cyclase domain-containing protein [Geminicoccaceae bacterium]|nr:adenylate/guanylate cyclase domain-containing protein [Geminicoccus sp.]HMU49978.1 adenylate/guanylate cyclase domain-containing protein [Geminicoccaceae bacterium]
MLRCRLAIGTALAGLMLLSVGSTAALIHLPWSWTARENVTDVARRLNGEIVASVSRELASVLNDTGALAEALRSILAQGTIGPEDEAKREFLFLSLLRSQPAVSRLSFGWPDGRYFGAEKQGYEHIRMIEVQGGRLRIDDYEAHVGDVMFLERRFAPSGFLASDQPWFTAAIDGQDAAWSLTGPFPDGDTPSITVAVPLDQYGRRLGVIAATIDLTRISDFLAGLQIGSTGTVAVLDPGGAIVASADPADIVVAEVGTMRSLSTLDPVESPLLAAIARTVADQKVDLASVALTSLYRLETPDAAYFVNLARLGFRGWTVATVIPERDFLAGIDRNTRRLLWLLFGFTAAMAVLAVLLSHRLIVRPLRLVEGQLRHIEAFRPEHVRPVSSHLAELDNLSTALDRMAQSLESFRRYLPAELVRTLVAQGVAARPELHRRELSVLFTDLAGFTGLSERLGEAVVPLLTRYLGLSTRAVLEHGGTVDKFIGDAVMAFWNAPLDDPGHALNACRAALRIQELMSELTDGHALMVRIGINSGEVLVGNIGSEDRLSYTAVGDVVNVASRLEGLNKRYGTQILIGEATRRLCGGRIHARNIDSVAVQGRQEATIVYELLGIVEPA